MHLSTLAAVVCIVAIHSTASAPAIGGVRRAAYPTLGVAVDIPFADEPLLPEATFHLPAGAAD